MAVGLILISFRKEPDGINYDGSCLPPPSHGNTHTLFSCPLLLTVCHGVGVVEYRISNFFVLETEHHKRVPDREEQGKPSKDARRGSCHPLE
jgi:hypothetical protein